MDDSKSPKSLARLKNSARAKSLDTYVSTADAIDFLRLIVSFLSKGSALDAAERRGGVTLTRVDRLPSLSSDWGKQDFDEDGECEFKPLSQKAQQVQGRRQCCGKVLRGRGTCCAVQDGSATARHHCSADVCAHLREGLARHCASGHFSGALRHQASAAVAGFSVQKEPENALS